MNILPFSKILLNTTPYRRIEFMRIYIHSLNKKRKVSFKSKLVTQIGGYKKYIFSLGSDLKNLGIPRLNVRSLFTFKTIKH